MALLATPVSQWKDVPLSEKGKNLLGITNVGKDSKGGLMSISGGTVPKEGSVLGASDSRENPGGEIKPPSKESSSKSSSKSSKESDAQKATSLAQKAQEISARNASAAAKAAIGQSWDKMGGFVDQTKNDVNSLGDPSTSLGQARDAMLGAYDRNFQKTTDAIAGNREVIQKNQKKDLADLADKVRKNIFGANISLGAGANGSAAGAAARAIQNAAGKDRASILTGYGDQISEQGQNETNAKDEYQLNRKKSYDWETKMREQAIAKYQANTQALNRLIDRVPDWKKADLVAENENNLKTLSTELASLGTQAANYRDYIFSVLDEANNSTQAIDESGINIDAPATLDTPEYSSEFGTPMDGGVDPSAESFYNPTVKNKKRYGDNPFGNPLTFDEAFGQA